jgi:hypothetical protein
MNRLTLILLARNWITRAGVALVTLAGFFWLFLLPLHLRGHVDNPYIGLLAFIAVPIVFFSGLALIPIGFALARRKGHDLLPGVSDRQAAWRSAGVFFAVMTVGNLLIGSQVTYRAVEHMETVQFCGQTCHVMKPEFTAHQSLPHQQVACVACHVGPGAAGWIKAKTAGTRQLLALMLNNFSRPIESAMESNRLVSSAETCEQCHAREKVIGSRLRVLTKFKDDEHNTRIETVLMMKVGGGAAGGIHGAHMGSGVTIRYAAADKKREDVPWVEYKDSRRGVSTTYLASATSADSIGKLPKFEMQCVDCHNRPAHTFETPETAVDAALLKGDIPSSLPFVKKVGVAAISKPYDTGERAERNIAQDLAKYYEREGSPVSTKQADAIQAATRSLLQIYRRNVFPDLKVAWKTYPNHLGHTDSPGCFRCHDDSHSSADKKTITQECSTCHEALAVEEADPDILKTMGLNKR